MTDKDKKNQSPNTQKDIDDALWAEVTKDIKPLEGREAVEPPKQETKKRKEIKRTPPPIQPDHKKSKTKTSEGSYEVDRRTEQRFKRGQMPIEGRIDLHGMSQNDAHHALLQFIPNASAQGKRCVLIITGKGYQRHGDVSLLDQKIGILKQKTPEWLKTPPLNQYVLKTATARPEHGGEGAMYVLLRKQRK